MRIANLNNSNRKESMINEIILDVFKRKNNRWKKITFVYNIKYFYNFFYFNFNKKFFFFIWFFTLL